MKTSLLIFLFLSSYIFAQKDSLAPIYLLKPGVFLTFADFKANNPISLDSISFREDNKSDNLLTKLKNNTSTVYIKNGKEGRINSEFIWGFNDNKKLYVSFNSTFNKASYVGSICTFFSYTTKMYNSQYGSWKGTQGSYKALTLFIMNYEDGIAMEATPKRLSKLLKKDQFLFHDYETQNKDKKHYLMEGYVKRFNEAHPSFHLY